MIDLRLGDCLDVMRTLEANSVDAIVTDPPYGLSFMGKKWDYDVPKKEIWEESLRVLKPGGHLLAFAGTRTQHRMAVNIEDAGYEIRDMIGWIYGSGFPKSHNLKDKWQGWGTALKPAMEPITVARKPFKGTVADNVLRYGTGAINVDGCRVRFGDESDSRVGTDTLACGSKESIFGGYSNIKDKNIQMYKDNGRWPANLIHDGSDEVVELFPVTSSKQTCAKRAGKHNTGRYGNFYGQENVVIGHNDSGSAARFFYCAKASKRDRDEGCEGMEVKQTTGGGGLTSCGDKFGSIKSPAHNHHPTVKPTDLMRYLCRLITPPNGLILDPFMGSGSTGKSAVLEGFNFIGIELCAEYLEIAKKRIEHAEHNKGLFA